ncbi:aminobenzoate synthetase [Staphylococcus microti]|uniref:Aminobenzoate synthetase n=1 Tax=Staphylococcus microti TaxID=569857 RepID=A0A0D6XTY7_9STAP|nr:aminodeoxychorismate synthase component I [Staphylococcus microti]KIX91696.1 aminobenzoate synthetase [Staphylococcus microti]PNZ84308.1 aminodeoxychorismate synthase, component I [Staphylococcus microti]SUM56796.1 para-aminobenzoate synthase component I [Staphylococcus microti]
MVVKFNYTYYIDEQNTEQYRYTFDQPHVSHVAYTLAEVGRVVTEAEKLQSEGYYVALYLPYEVAPYYNAQFKTYTPVDGIYAACYAFESPVEIEEINTVKAAEQAPMPAFNFAETKETITENVRTIQREIVDGWTYQVNYTTRLEARATAPIHVLYDALTQQANGNYTALLETDELKVASISPELFFQVGSFADAGRTVMSKPMKGTMPRGVTHAEDQANYKALQQSAKDRAENIMIVDLLRNDIARIARQGTVRVGPLCAIETYPTVYQMTTMVLGTITRQTTLNDLLGALFPCGSITGAPKVHTMSIIHRLEPTPRHCYCGTIGLLRPEGNAVFNVPIRTVQQFGERFVYGVGAGITIDSDPEQEYIEFHDKTRILKGS